MTASDTSPTGSIDPLLVDLGLAIGLLTQSGQTVSLNTGWFSDPLSSLKTITTNTPQNNALQSLLDGLFGSMAASGLGAASGADLGSNWYPLSTPGATGASSYGLYLVYDDSEATAPVYGLGFLANAGTSSLRVTPYAVAPLVSIRAGESGVKDANVPTEYTNVLGTESNPIQFGLMVTGAGGAFGSGEISFSGIKLAVSLSGGAGPTVDLQILDLSGPGLPSGDISIAGSAGDALSVDDWIALVLGLMAGQAGDDPGASSFYDLLVMLGGAGTVPALDWSSLFTSPEAALSAWLGTLCATKNALPTLLNALCCLVNGTTPKADGSDIAVNVSGAGAVANPYAITVFADTGLTMNFTLAIAIVDGQTQIIPGVQVLPAATTPLTTYPDIQAQLQGAIQIATITLGAGTLSAEPFPSFGVLLRVGNSQPNGLLMSAEALSVGAAQAGVTYTAGAASPFSPSFALLNVTSGNNNWASIDPSNFSTNIASVATTALQTALTEYMAQSATLSALATATGLTVPAGAPSDYQTIPQNYLDAALAAPLTALGSFYTYLITTETQGAAYITYALPSLAAVLSGQAASGLAITGSGSAADPWLAPLDSGGAVFLSATTTAGGSEGGPILTLGLSLSLSGTATATVDPTVTATIGLVSLPLPDSAGNGAGSPVWLPNLTAGLTLTGPNAGALTLPTIGGVTLGATDFAAGFQWSSGFAWYASLSGVTVAGAEKVTIGDLGVSGGAATPVPDSLAADVDTLATLAVNTVGMGLLSDGGRPGALVATALGLLPDLPTLYQNGGGGGILLPVGVTLPSGWPLLPTGATLLSDGIGGALQSQIAALFAPGSAFANTAMQVLGWALTGTAPALGTATGSQNDPWTAPLGFAGLNAAVFSASDGGTIGVGFGLCMTLAQETIAGVTLTITAELTPTVMPASGSGPAPGAGGLPTLSVTTVLANATANTPLIGGDADDELTIGSLQFGVTVSSGSDGLTVTPVIELTKACVGANCVPGTITLTAGSGGTPYSAEGIAQAAFETLLNAAVGTLSQAAAGSTVIGPLLSLLSDLAILQSPTAPATDYGVNAGSWTAFLANPTSFLMAQAKAVADSPTLFASAVGSVEALLGLKPPSSWGAVPDVLAAFGLMRAAPGGYVPAPSAWLSLVENPAAYLSAQADALFVSGSPALTAVVAALADSGLPTDGLTIGDFTFQATNPAQDQAILTLTGSLPGASGPVLSVNLGLAVDFRALTVSGTLTFDLPALAQSLILSCGNGTPAFTVSLTGDGGAVAAFPPLTLYPSAMLPAVDAVAERVALALLAQGAAQLLTNEVLPAAPVVGTLLQGLSLTRSTADSLQVCSLLPALLHPINWVLSPNVLGDGGGDLDLAKLGTLLGGLTDTAISGPGGLSVRSVADGLALSGLPFGMTATLTSAISGLTLGVGASPTLGAGLTVAISGDIGYAPTTGLALTTKMTLEETLSSLGVFSVSTSYDTASGVGLTLSVPTSAGTSPVAVTLVPYPGLSALAMDFGQAVEQGLLQTIATDIASAYNNWLQNAPDPQLKTVLTQVVSIGGTLGLTNVDAVVTQVGAMATTGGSLIGGWFNSTNCAALIGDIVSLLSTDLGISGVQKTTSPSGLTYPLSFTVDGIVGAATLSFGQEEQDGSALALGLSATVSIGLLHVSLDATVAFDISTESCSLTLDNAITVDLAKAGAAPMPYAPSLSLDIAYASGFTLGLDVATTVDDAQSASLGIALLPTPSLTSGGQTVTGFEDWLADLLIQVVLPAVANTLLGQPEVADFLNQSVGASSVTVGKVIAGAGLLAGNSAQPTVYTLSSDIASLPDAPLLSILGNGLTTLLNGGTVVTLMKLPNSGALSLVGGDNQIGINLVLPDLPLSSSPTRTLTLQLGQWLTGDTAQDNWVSRADGDAPTALAVPGLTVYVLNASGDGQYSLEFGLDLISVGFDIDGVATAPLVSAGGLTLDGIELRAAVSVGADFSDIVYGGAIRADNVGLPLGPQLAQVSGASGNGVAQSLLASGSGSGGTTQDAVNPPFSTALSFLSGGGDPAIAFYDASGALASSLTLPVQRSFGPLYCASLSLGSGGGGDFLDLGFTGSVKLDVLNISLDGFSIGIPLATPQDFNQYQLSLSGLDVSLTGGVSVTGALIELSDPISYSGEINIAAPGFSLGGMGSYAVVDNGVPSLFAYAQYAPTAPLGGPPFFFVTGLAGGFGFNRSLLLPAVADVESFPLVAMATTNVAGSGTELAQNALAQLEAVAPITLGEYWLAAGVTFTSFQIVKSVAVLTIEFGDTLAIDLIGCSTLQMPQDSPWVQAIMGLEVSFQPAAGALQAIAELAPSSYILSPQCQLTGGFAFSTWFSGPNDGQFVITLGGYNPQFTPPSYYPQVPRLGINWQPGDGVSITGGSYYALTPAFMMAGGALDVSYRSGGLSAWLTAYADMLIRWNPFAYDVDIGVGLGASYTGHTLFTWTISIDMSVDLTLWGPPFAGVATVNWSVISFTIDIGDTSSPPMQPTNLTWSSFNSAFLPQLADNPVLAQFRPLAGLVSTSNGAWVVDPDQFQCVVELSAPTTNATLQGAAVEGLTGQAIGVPSLGLYDLSPSLDISLTSGDWNIVGSANVASVSAYLWGQTALEDLMAPTNGANTLNNVVTGITLSADATAADAGPQTIWPSVPISLLLGDTLSAIGLTLPTDILPERPARIGTGASMIATTVMDPAVVATRKDLIAAAAGLTGFALNDAGDLSVLAAYAADLLPQVPLHGGLASYPPASLTAKAGLPTSQKAVPHAADHALPPPPPPPPPRTMGAQAPRVEAAFRMVGAGSAASHRKTGIAVHRWTASAHSDDVTMIRHMTTPVGDGRAMTLAAGDSLLCRLDTSSGTPFVLTSDGTAPAWAVAVAEPGRRIQTFTLPAGSATPVTLPAKTDRLAVVAPGVGSTDGTAEGDWSGWMAPMTLVQIAPGIALGRQAVLALQNGQMRRHRRQKVGSGVIHAAMLSQGNRVQDSDRSVEPGFTITHLPGGGAAVVVVVASDDGKAQPPVAEVRLLTDGPTLTPVGGSVDGAERQQFYRVTGERSADTIQILVRPAIGSHTLGVLGGTAEGLEGLTARARSTAIPPVIPPIDPVGPVRLILSPAPVPGAPKSETQP